MKKIPIIKYDLKSVPRTGEWRYMSPKVDEEKCTACGTCVKFCPEATIEIRSSKKQVKIGDDTENNSKECAKVDYEFCKGCGVCANVCPVRAITMEKIK